MTEEPDYENLELRVEGSAYKDAPKPFTLWDRYVIWSSLHTLNPLAWPWVIYMSIIIWLEKRAQKDD